MALSIEIIKQIAKQVKDFQDREHAKRIGSIIFSLKWVIDLSMKYLGYFIIFYILFLRDI